MIAFDKAEGPFYFQNWSGGSLREMRRATAAGFKVEVVVRRANLRPHLSDSTRTERVRVKNNLSVAVLFSGLRIIVIWGKYRCG